MNQLFYAFLTKIFWEKLINGFSVFRRWQINFTQFSSKNQSIKISKKRKSTNVRQNSSIYHKSHEKKTVFTRKHITPSKFHNRVVHNWNFHLSYRHLAQKKQTIMYSNNEWRRRKFSEGEIFPHISIFFFPFIMLIQKSSVKC